MKFLVHIDPKAWTRVARRLERAGIVGTPAEVLEVMLATALSDESSTPRHIGDQTITSTSIMLTLGRLKVEQVPNAENE